MTAANSHIVLCFDGRVLIGKEEKKYISYYIHSALIRLATEMS
jgi:hypothetical protein